MEVNYNKRAFIYGIVIFMVGIVCMIIGEIMQVEFAFLVGGILALVAILSVFMLAGMIFVLQAYSEPEEPLE